MKRLIQYFCRHRFAIEDLTIVRPGLVLWTCDKCGKVFKGSSGLDISAGRGEVFRRLTGAKDE
jgi:ribosomal protein L37AE/L43A